MSMVSRMFTVMMTSDVVNVYCVAWIINHENIDC